MTASYPSAVITWVDRVDNVDYNYAGDINSAIAEIQGISKDLVGVGGTAGGLAQGGASFYARWVNQHNTDGTHKAITASSVSASGTITATSGFLGNLTGAVTGNASTATTSPNHSGTYAHNQAVATTSDVVFNSVRSAFKSSDNSSGLSGTLTITLSPQSNANRVVLVFKNGILTSQTISSVVATEQFIAWA
jgi:hypothetical protein